MNWFYILILLLCNSLIYSRMYVLIIFICWIHNLIFFWVKKGNAQGLVVLTTEAQALSTSGPP